MRGTFSPHTGQSSHQRRFGVYLLVILCSAAASASHTPLSEPTARRTLSRVCSAPPSGESLETLPQTGLP